MKRTIFLIFCLNITCCTYGQSPVQHRIVWHGYIDKSQSLKNIEITDLNNAFLEAIQKLDETNRYFEFVPSYSSENVPNSPYTLEGIIEKNDNGYRISTRLYYKQNVEIGAPCSNIVSPNYFTKTVEEHALKKYKDLVERLIPHTPPDPPLNTKYLLLQNNINIHFNKITRRFC